MEFNSSKPSSTKIDRKTIEKNRRNQMKTLYSQLNSLVPGNATSSTRPLSVPDQIDEATNYIKRLQENVENLKRVKENYLSEINADNAATSSSMEHVLKLPVKIEAHENGSALEVILVTGMDCQFVFTDVIRILHEEKAEVVNASYSVEETTVFHNIHAQIGEGTNVAQISERLKMFNS